jgi:hypothetical protein
MPIFTVIFEDDTVFAGGDSYSNTKWGEIPNKKIKTLIYNMPFGDTLALAGYDAFYHIVEILNDLNGANAGKPRLDKVSILAKKADKVKMYTFNLYRSPPIEIKILQDSDTFIQKLNQEFWK